MFKKIAFLLLLNLLITNPSFAYNVDDMPDYELDDVNGNIKDHGFRIVGTNIASNEMFPIEIITLEKKGWVLKCKVRYASQRTYTVCYYP